MKEKSGKLSIKTTLGMYISLTQDIRSQKNQSSEITQIDFFGVT